VLIWKASNLWSWLHSEKVSRVEELWKTNIVNCWKGSSKNYWVSLCKIVLRCNSESLESKMLRLNLRGWNVLLNASAYFRLFYVCGEFFIFKYEDEWCVYGVFFCVQFFFLRVLRNDWTWNEVLRRCRTTQKKINCCLLKAFFITHCTRSKETQLSKVRCASLLGAAHERKQM